MPTGWGMSASDQTSAVSAAEWRPDPTAAGQWRWWDGTRWTDQVAPMVAQPAAAAPRLAVVSNLEPVPPLGLALYPREPSSATPTPFSVLRRQWKRHRLAWRILIAAFGVSLFVPAIPQGLLLVCGLTLLGWEWRRSVSTVWDVLLEARGFQPGPVEEGVEMSAALPVLERGLTHFGPTARGTLRGLPVTCGQADVMTGSGKHKTRTEYAFAAFRLPEAAAARHPGVSVRTRGGALHGRTTGREVRFESTAMDKRLRVVVDDRASDLATRELFGPQLVAELADVGAEWDQRGRHLFVFRRLTQDFAAEFDPMCSTAAAIARAYWMDQR
ncbi:MAG: hypothetical protein JWM98_539 [Thermoleophilia bacterium]|nr:hypothetical protein [Thermoleophilia bacterium]